MRRRWWLVVPVLLALLAVQCLVLPPVALAAPTCLEAADPALPDVLQNAADSRVDRASDLAEDGRLDAAERAYGILLHSRDGNASSLAGAGLGYVQERRILAERVAASAERMRAAGQDATSCFQKAIALDQGNAEAQLGQDAAPAGQATPAGRAAERWDSLYEGWIDPVARVLVPTLAVLAVLLVLARTLTPLVVPVRATALGNARRRKVWAAGFALLVVAALASTTLPVRASWLASTTLSVPAPWLGALLSTLLVVVLVWLTVRLLRGFGRTQRGIARSAWAAAALLGVVVWTLSDLTPWAVAAAVAIPGLVLVATGRGHALRLRVTVMQAGKDDPTGTAYVLARLQELGSSPPEGLKTPQQVDVSELPSAALSALPAGRVAAAITSLVDVLLPAVPWRAKVEDGEGDSRLVVTITRNGRGSRTALVDASRFLPHPGAADDESPMADRGNLLTAAAAVVLTELAERHIELQRGLCGATRWDSVAAHVVATKPPATAGGRELRRELLAYAVDADPRNALAWAAYVNLLGEQATTEMELRRFEDRLVMLRRHVEQQALHQEGYLALRLRVAHALTATQVNLALAQTNPAMRWGTGMRAGASRLALTELTAKAPANAGERRFAQEMAAIADELHRAIKAVLAQPVPATAGSPSAPAAPLARAAVTEPILGRRPSPPSLHVTYYECCREARFGDPERALDKLEFAAGLEAFRTMARRDPWFHVFRADDPTITPEQRDRFWSLVGTPDPSFTDLPPFGDMGPVLRARGIGDPTTLLAATESARGFGSLGRVLDVPHGVVEGWRSFAHLATPRGRTGPRLSSRELYLLASVGVRSLTDLDDRRSGLLAALAGRARQTGVRPPTAAEFDSWFPPDASPARPAQQDLAPVETAPRSGNGVGTGVLRPRAGGDVLETVSANGGATGGPDGEPGRG
jgi:hypothetical protein